MIEDDVPSERQSSIVRLPGGIWALGFVSLFMDISSEMIHGLLPVFLTSVLGASTEMIGLIEGVGEATASISKLFSGWVSDRLGKRKALAIIGYGLAALSKPLFALAPTSSLVLAARFSDRIGKGIRGAPRDAMVGDMVPAGLRGAAYGLRQALDTIGAFAGPLIAIALMATLHDNFRLIFWLALIPGLLSVLVLLVGVREPPHEGGAAQAPLKLGDLRSIGTAYWIVVGIGAVLTLARFSEAFLILRAQTLGLSLALAPLVLVIMNIVYAFSAYPLGALSDRIDRKLMLAFGFAILVAADTVLAIAPNLPAVMAGVALWGLHMGMTQGLLSALVADEAPTNLRATAFGLFNFVSGMALLLASLIAGALWEVIGPYATFMAGAAFTAIGLVGTVMVLRR
ncbi:MAG TPA: MFS transporter [Bradyrhizobium sp.]|uniref:MFS transporter n=1 Tax=Bradyrhizobium sp. TaxID=376 RepID=UPI002BDA1F40|nr:MFS transporter [Bradyrhizobium sp.]HLZ01076.1 MFS transporter [Bradyrhizobium sp.]